MRRGSCEAHSGYHVEGGLEAPGKEDKASPDSTGEGESGLPIGPRTYLPSLSKVGEGAGPQYRAGRGTRRQRGAGEPPPLSLSLPAPPPRSDFRAHPQEPQAGGREQLGGWRSWGASWRAGVHSYTSLIHIYQERETREKSSE